ncbi:MAG: hypothetical protein ABL886_10215, partial [Rhodoglobus sp.]
MSVTFDSAPGVPGVPPGGGALRFDAASAALETVAGIDRMMASLSGVKAQLIANAYDSVLLDLGARRVPPSAGVRAELARQTLVTELAALLRITPVGAAHLVSESRALTTTL